MPEKWGMVPVQKGVAITAGKLCINCICSLHLYFELEGIIHCNYKREHKYTTTRLHTEEEAYIMNHWSTETVRSMPYKHTKFAVCKQMLQHTHCNETAEHILKL